MRNSQSRVPLLGTFRLARWMLLASLSLLPASSVSADEATALAISRSIQAAHAPFGLVLDVVYTAPGSGTPMGYLGYGDAALWTGVYLGAEAHRFAVTKRPDALENVRRTLSA